MIRSEVPALQTGAKFSEKCSAASTERGRQFHTGYFYLNLLPLPPLPVLTIATAKGCESEAPSPSQFGVPRRNAAVPLKLWDVQNLENKQ